ncbi:hypothetical protein ACWC09_43615 [Streptomyces sp. NPDC001617]
MPIISTLIDIRRPSSVVVEPAAMWSGGAHRWYSASGREKSQLAMSILSMGAWMVWLYDELDRTRSVRTSSGASGVVRGISFSQPFGACALFR